MVEAVAWTILVVIIIALVVGLVDLVFEVIIAALAAIFAGMAAGYLVLGAANWAHSKKIQDPANLASIGELRLTPKGLSFEFVDARVKDLALSGNMNWLAALSSAGIAVWAIYLGATANPSIYASLSPNWLSVIRIIVWVVPFALLVIFAKGAGLRNSRESHVRSRVETLAERLRLCLASASTLDSLEGQIASLAKSFNITWPNQYRRALETYIKSNAPQLLCDAQPAEELLNSLAALARIDYERLEDAQKRWNRVWSRYDKLASTLRYASRPALARELDGFAEGLPHLAALLPRRQWEQFAADVTDAENELESLEGNAKAPPVVDQNTPSQNCYQVLRVSPDMTFSEIKLVYLRLVKTYSPDGKQMSERAKKILERQFQEINDAWAEIERIHRRDAAGN